MLLQLSLQRILSLALSLSLKGTIRRVRKIRGRVRK